MIDRNRYRRKAIDIFDITQARGQAPHLGEKEKKISVSEKKKRNRRFFSPVDFKSADC